MSAVVASITVEGDWKLLLLFIPVALVWWWLARQLDLPRIRNYGEARGWRFEAIVYEGATGGDEERLYAVRYVDAQGDLHTAQCKTSRTTGVYFTDVRRLGRPPQPTPTATHPPVDCPRCGHTVGAAETACPNCTEPRPGAQPAD